MERERGGSAVSGSWQGKDLAAFAPAQAKFLSANTNWIATERGAGNKIDFSACTDLPCILNQVYGNGATEQGWKVYYFYLAMGYSLSCRDYVPMSGARWTESPLQAVFTAPFQSYLWSDVELTALWKLSSILPSAYHFIGTQRFHRVPDTAQVPSPSWCPGGRSGADGKCICPEGQTDTDGTCKVQSSTCADSWGNKDHGFVRAKRCLDEDNFGHIIYDGDDPSLEDNGIRGQIYMTLTHELTHTWDRSQSNGISPQGFLAEFSDTEEWQKFSGWHIETVVNESGVKSFRWAITPGGEGFVRDYAGSDPREDLAETAAWVRLRAELVSKPGMSPKKAAFLSQKLFDGRTYDVPGLIAYYEDSTVKQVTPQLLELVNGCLTQATSASVAPRAATGPHLTVDHSLPDAMLGCLESELNARITVALNGLRGVEWEACDLLDKQEAKVRADVFTRVNTDVSRLVSQNIDQAPVIRAIRELRTALSAAVDPREAYIHCFKQPQPETCYQQAVGQAYDQVLQPFAAQLSSVASEEKTAYLAQNSFNDAKTRTRLFYGQVFAGVEPMVSASAAKRWKACLDATAADPSDPSGPGAAPASDAMPLLAPFSGGAHFVAASILNCVDSSFDGDLKSVRDAFVSRLGLSVSDPDTQALIQELLLPGYLDALRSLEDAAAAAEDALRARRKQGVLDVLAAALVRDLSWMNSSLTVDAATVQCVPVAEAAFNDYFSRVSEAERLPTRFAAIEDVRTRWTREACSAIVARTEVTMLLKQREPKAWAAAMTALEWAVKSRAKALAAECAAGRGGTTAWSRKTCLTAAKSWTDVETKALADWAQSIEGRSFASTRKTEATAYLVAHRKVLQKAAVSAMEGH